jgi:hypothetical protein
MEDEHQRGPRLLKKNARPSHGPTYKGCNGLSPPFHTRCFAGSFRSPNHTGRPPPRQVNGSARVESRCRGPPEFDPRDSAHLSYQTAGAPQRLRAERHSHSIPDLRSRAGDNIPHRAFDVPGVKPASALRSASSASELSVRAGCQPERSDETRPVSTGTTMRPAPANLAAACHPAPTAPVQVIPRILSSIQSDGPL